MFKKAAETSPNDVLNVKTSPENQFVHATRQELSENENAESPVATEPNKEESNVANRENMPETERITEKDVDPHS